MHIERNLQQLNTNENITLQVGIVRALVYFDIFQYPLTINEIALFCDVKIYSMDALQTELDKLTSGMLLYRFDELYCLQNDEALAERRRNGNHQAAATMPKAIQRSRFIQRFPFVRSVNISGSMSKNYFDDQTDLDFFIIAQPGRIWICRLLLTLYKKIFLLNARKYFCINYYIDTNHLAIPDQNLFAATEIITLKNQTGENWYQAFMESNPWVKEYFPNHIPVFSHLPINSNSRLKQFVEKICEGKFGNLMDNGAQKLTILFLKKKYSALQQEEFEVNLRSEKHVSKHHPQGFQFKVLAAFETKCREFESIHHLPVSHA